MATITICSDFGAQKIKSDTVSSVSPTISHEVMGPEAMIFIFWMLSFKPTFSLSYFTCIKRLLGSSSLSAIRVVSFAYLRSLIFLWQSWFQLVLLPAQRFSWCTLFRVAAAAAAKSLQSCLTLCNPIDSSLPGPSIHGIFQARVLEWVAIAFSALQGYFPTIPGCLDSSADKESSAMEKTLIQFLGRENPLEKG